MIDAKSEEEVNSISVAEAEQTQQILKIMLQMRHYLGYAQPTLSPSIISSVATLSSGEEFLLMLEARRST